MPHGMHGAILTGSARPLDPSAPSTRRRRPEQAKIGRELRRRGRDVSELEVAANLISTVAIVLAGRNSVHTWWIGIVGCVLFAVLLWQAALPAGATLQVFFIGACVYGWWNWERGGPGGQELPVRRAGLRLLGLLVLGGVAVTLGYAWLMVRTTDTAAPVPDSAVLAFSIVAQLLLMFRRIETWWFWILVNGIGIPLYASRGLYLTACFSVVVLGTSALSLRHWRRLLTA